MSFKTVIITPPIVSVAGDPFGDISYMSTGALYLAGHLKRSGVEIRIVDGFGEAPERMNPIGPRLVAAGLTEPEILSRLDSDESLVGISLHSGMSHSIGVRLAAEIRKRNPNATIIAGGHHASAVTENLLANGFDYVCVGEGENVALSLVRSLRDGDGRPEDIPGLAHPAAPHPASQLETDLDQFGFAWFGGIPIENYWRAGTSHAPIRGRHVSITTSRGCPYNCRFCTTPQILGRRWRSRSPEHVVDEMEWALKTFGASEIVIQDEIFGVQKKHARGIADEILRRGLKLRLYLPSGVKIETLDDETLTHLRRAGLQYMCLAPESGSRRILKKMDKPLDFDRFYGFVRHARSIGVRLGCFFVLGFEDENDDDRRQTRKMISRLAALGADEVSLFIWSPLPGADAFGSESGWKDYEDLNWSPAWRKTYPALAAYRRSLYIQWFALKALRRPFSLVRSVLNVFFQTYELKSEMAFRRLLKGFGFWVKSRLGFG